jgi:hypothetical protein
MVMTVAVLMVEVVVVAVLMVELVVVLPLVVKLELKQKIRLTLMNKGTNRVDGVVYGGALFLYPDRDNAKALLCFPWLFAAYSRILSENWLRPLHSTGFRINHSQLC